MVRLQPDLLAFIDAWRSEFSGSKPSRPEAIRLALMLVRALDEHQLRQAQGKPLGVAVQRLDALPGDE